MRAAAKNQVAGVQVVSVMIPCVAVLATFAGFVGCQDRTTVRRPPSRQRGAAPPPDLRPPDVTRPIDMARPAISNLEELPKKEASEVLIGRGALTREEIRGIISKNINQVGACYERAILKDPDIPSKIVFRWEVNPAGRVEQVQQMTKGPRLEQVGRCISARLKTWRFPLPSGGGRVTITYPFMVHLSGI